MKRIIFHVDVNSAFLSWEAVYRLYHLGGQVDLREIPSAVGGDQEKRHGIILAKSIPAKAFKIQTGEPVIDAKRKCPQLVIVPPNYSLYRRSSDAFMKILSEYSDCVEPYSIDEAFMDMTGCTDDPESTANRIRERIREELGFTVNIGVAPNKLLAKMASDFKKPDLVHTLWREEIPAKLWPLPVRALFFVGSASEGKLRSVGIQTIGELAACDPVILRQLMKSHGVTIWQYANGIDESEVLASPLPNKGYGNSLTTARDVMDAKTAYKYLLSLAETVAARLRADGAKAGVVDLSLRDASLTFYHHQRKLSEPTDLTVELYQAACRCFDKLWKGYPIRHLGIHTSALTRDSARQINLFSTFDYEKQRNLELAVDRLRRRFGNDCVMRAVFAPPGCGHALKDGRDCSTDGRRNLLEKRAGALPWADGKLPQIDHMGGGISREKRSVDYAKEIIL